MSALEPGVCRNMMCEERATFYAEMVGTRGEDKWDGEFCLEHLQAAVALKITGLPTGCVVIVERLVYEEYHQRQYRREGIRHALYRGKKG